MTPAPQSDGELLPPHSAARAPMPDFEREVSRPNSRERGWNILATPGTYILLAINIAVFGWMVLHGVSAKDPTTEQLIHYGATNAYLVLCRPVVASAHRDLRSRRPAPHRHQHVVSLEPRSARRTTARPGRPDRGLPDHRRRGKSAESLIQCLSSRRHLCRCRSLRSGLRHRRYPYRPALEQEAAYPGL